MTDAAARPNLDEETERAEVIKLARGTAAVYCARSPFKTDDLNEDGAVLIPVDADRTILAVADGMGGHAFGAEASEIALRALGETVRAAGGPGETGLRGAILNGFEAANTRVIETTSGAGTTLAVVEVDGVTVRPYHVGDSVILVVGQRGKMKLQTVAHSPVGYAVESGLLDESDAMHHEDRHVISNFVGLPEMRIEIGATLTLSPRDTLLLGSDGLFDNLHVEEVVAHVRKGSLERIADAMAALARSRMIDPTPDHPSKPDDLTFVIYRPDSSRR